MDIPDQRPGALVQVGNYREPAVPLESEVILVIEDYAGLGIDLSVRS